MWYSWQYNDYSQMMISEFPNVRIAHKPTIGPLESMKTISEAAPWRRHAHAPSPPDRGFLVHPGPIPAKLAGVAGNGKYLLDSFLLSAAYISKSYAMLKASRRYMKIPKDNTITYSQHLWSFHRQKEVAASMTPPGTPPGTKWPDTIQQSEGFGVASKQLWLPGFIDLQLKDQGTNGSAYPPVL